MAGFCLLFWLTVLPNNPQYSRLDLWSILPIRLVNLLLPGGPQGELPTGWEYVPQRWDLLLTAGFLLAGGWSVGHLLLRCLRPPLPPRCLERTVLAFALGLSGLSLLTLGCGLAGWLERPLLGTLLMASLAGEVGFRCLPLMRRKPREGERDAAEKHFHPKASGDRHLPTACLPVVSPFLLAMLLGAMLPSVDFDVKEYHLQGPKEFYQNGRITFLPHNVYTSFPFFSEMLSLLGMVLRGDWFRGALVGKTVLCSFAPLTAATLFVIGRRWLHPAAGWLAAVIYLTTPWTYRLAIIAYAEGALSFYLAATLLAVMLAWEQPAGGAESPESRVQKAEGRQSRRVGRQTHAISASNDMLRWVSRPTLQLTLLAGLLAGSAMACKYPAAVSVVLPAGIAVGLAVWRHRAGERPLRAVLAGGGVFALGVLLTVGPWLLKNTVETGNPVYPLLYSVFGGRDWDPALNAKWRAAHSPETYALGDLAGRVVDVTVKNDWLSPLLYGLAPLALLSPRLSRWLWLYVAYLYLSWWGLTHRIDRFWVPMLPVVALLAGMGAAWTTQRLWRSGCGLLMGAAILFNLGFITSPLGGFNAYLADLNAARQVAASTAGGIASLNSRLPADAKVLCVGEAQVFDARFPVVYNTVFDRSLFEQWCAADTNGKMRLRDPQTIRRTFRQEGITHVYVNWQEILRYRPTYGYTDFVHPERFAALRRQGVLDAGFTLGYRRWKSLSSQARREVQTWAPGLQTTVNGENVLISSQVFPVRR